MYCNARDQTQQLNLNILWFNRKIIRLSTYCGSPQLVENLKGTGIVVVKQTLFGANLFRLTCKKKKIIYYDGI